MGLDMYLSRINTHGYPVQTVSTMDNYLDWQRNMAQPNAEQRSFEEWCHGDESEVTPELLDTFRPDFITRYDLWDTQHKYPHESLFEDVGYWRKANHIHNWFVWNVQDGVDDCEWYAVTKGQLQELRDTCQQVLNIAKVKRGNIQVGIECDKGGKMTPIIEDGDIVLNAVECEEILPTRSGFFFGGTDYDEYYLRACWDTIEIIDNVLATTDFDTQTIVYGSSW